MWKLLLPFAPFLVQESTSTLSYLFPFSRQSILLGDININGTNQLSPEAEKYLQATTSSGAFFLITKATRVMDNSATVTDHIITNDVEHTVMPFVIQSSIIDHCAVMSKISKIQTSCNKTPFPLYRNEKNSRGSFFWWTKPGTSQPCSK